MPREFRKVCFAGIGLALLSLACAAIRVGNEDYAWNQAISYIQEASGESYSRCFENMTYLKPTFVYVDDAVPAGQYWPGQHKIVYATDSVLFHESLHAIIYGAPRDCLEHALIHGAVKSDRLKRELAIARSLR